MLLRESILFSIFLLPHGVRLSSQSESTKKQQEWALDSTDQQGELNECLLDNNGAPIPAHQPYSISFKQMDPRIRCNLRSVNAHEVDVEPHVIIYPNPHLMDSNCGIDLLPETRHELPLLSKAASLNQGGTLNQQLLKLNEAHGKVQLQSCDEESETGGFVSRKVGPIVTVGSEAWVEFGVNDVGVKDILQHHSEGFWISEVSTLPVDEEGNPLGYPPLHIHHMHWTPGPTIFRRDPAKCFVLGDANHCHAETAGIEIHGDYQCKEEDGGMDCLNRGSPTGTGRFIRENWGLQSHIIDARPASSLPLKWYLQSSFTWSFKEAEKRPLSTFELSPLLRTAAIDGHNAGSLWVRTDSPSFHWWSDTFRREGKLVHFILHSHSKAFKEVLVFQGTSKDIGLDGDYFRWVKGLSSPLEKESNQASSSQRPEDYGFSSSMHVRSYVLENLARTRENNKMPELKAEGMVYEPSLKCQGYTGLEYKEIDGQIFSFDRRAKVCCKPWTFEQGTPWIAVAFFNYNRTQRPWNTPNVDATLFPMHVGFFFHYVGTGQFSTYDTEQGTQTYPPPNENLKHSNLFNSALGAALMQRYHASTPPERIPFILAKYYQWHIAFEWTIYLIQVYTVMYWPVILLLTLLTLIALRFTLTDLKEI